VAGRAFAQVFGKPGLGLHFFVQNSRRRVVKVRWSLPDVILQISAYTFSLSAAVPVPGKIFRWDEMSKQQTGQIAATKRVAHDAFKASVYACA
jgi:hypothetical protein